MFFSSLFRRVLAALFFALSLAAGRAWAGDVILDNLSSREDRGLLRIARVEVINSNLSADDVRALLDAGSDQNTVLGLASRFTADRMTINGMTFSGDDGTIIFAPLMMTGVDQGRVAQIMIDGADLDLRTPDGNTSQLKIRALQVERADFASFLQSLLAGHPEKIDFRAEKFVWAGFDWFVADPKLPANAPGGNRLHFALAGLNATTEYVGDIPVRSAAEVNGLTIELPPSSDGGRALANMGYKKLDFSITGQLSYSPTTRDLTIQNYAITGGNIGRLTIGGAFGNVDPSLLTGGMPQQKFAAFMVANIAQLDLRFDNDGGVENGFAFAAAQQGKSAAALRAETSALAVQFLPMLLGGDPSALPLAQAVQTFLKDPKNVALTLKSRGAPLPLARLSAIGDPITFLALVEVSLKSNQ